MKELPLESLFWLIFSCFQLAAILFYGYAADIAFDYAAFASPPPYDAYAMPFRYLPLCRCCLPLAYAFSSP